MALGDFHLFSWKSKATREKEQAEYEQWAFPYGSKQRDKLETLIKELCPKEPTAFVMMGYLTCKELYERILQSTGSVEEAQEILINREKKYKNVIRKHEMARCIALVQANAQIDENCEYPSAEEMRTRIAKLEVLRKTKKD